MQKLVTIYLDNGAYREGRMMMKTDFAEKHGYIEEHLQNYLAEGWSVAQIHGFGGNAESPLARGWITVVLEKK